MARFKILVSDGLAEAGLALLQSVGEVINYPKISAAELLEVLPEYQALVVRSRTKVTAEVIEAGWQLIVIGRAGVGVDNIDVEAAIAHGITVVNSPLAATNAVAEHTLALMLALARKVASADASMKGQKWEKSAFMGSELSGKTLGLLGLGRIGARVANLAAGFGMAILAFDPLIEPQIIRERGAEPVTFEEALMRSDFLSLHLPLTPATRNLIGPAQFEQMKPGARLICTARGGVVDEGALRQALDSNHLAGAALDVFANEPPFVGSIAEHPKVIATPHISAQTEEAQLKAGLAIAEEVIAVLNGKEPRWRVSSVD
jgi:D-3-phosphoglycerate dehydrogenase